MFQNLYYILSGLLLIFLNQWETKWANYYIRLLFFDIEEDIYIHNYIPTALFSCKISCFS